MAMILRHSFSWWLWIVSISRLHRQSYYRQLYLCDTDDDISSQFFVGFVWYRSERDSVVATVLKKQAKALF
jgi:hypothetical protein